MQQTSDKQLEASLDNNAYNDAQLIEMKVPLNMPYETTWSSYQRYNGEIEVKGTLYKYVKRKVCNDTLYVMCIANTKKMHLENAKDNFFKITNDLQNSNSKKSDNSKGGSIKNQQNEYDQLSFAINSFATFAGAHKSWLSLQKQQTLAAPHISPEQPPDSNKA